MRRRLTPLVPRAALAVAGLLALGSLGTLGAVSGVGTARAHAASAPPPTAVPTAAPTYHPTLQLSATQGAAGAALVVVASGFPPIGQVTLYWDGAYLARGDTDDAGYLSLRTAVPPDAADGPHEVRAVGPAHTAAGAAFTVAAPPPVTYHPALAASPAQGLPGARLVALASGFPPNGQVTLSWDGATLGHATADDSGAARLDTAIPATGAGSSAGPHELRVVGPAHTTASAPVAVLDPAQVYHPALTLDAAQGQRSAHVALAATGFAPNQDVHFYWDRIGGTDLGAARADTGGNADHTITIGQGFSVTDGAHRLYAAGSNPTLAASTFYTVQPTPPACGGLSIPIPFGSPVCLDPFGWLGSWLRDQATAAGNAVGHQVASALIAQPDYTTVPELGATFAVVQGLARDLFGVLFLAGALTWYARRLGLGPAGESLTQVVEGGLGLAVTTALPWMLHLYIDGVNGAATLILSDPHGQGASIVGDLVIRLVTPDLLTLALPFPPLLLVVLGFVLLFFVLLILVIITRVIGVIYAMAVYLAAPVCVVCMATPLTRGVAKAWARLWFSLTLWGVAYAFALVADRAMLAVFAREPAFSGGLQAMCEALAGALVIYGAPRLADALLGGGASRALGIGNVPLLGTAVNIGASAALGAAGGGIASMMRGATTDAAVPSGAVATPAAPTVTEMGPPMAALSAPIEAEWGLIE